MEKIKKIIIVGSFSAEKKGIYGGISRSCEVLMNSNFASRFVIVPVDSTQISTPPPGFFIRLFFAARRMVFFLGKLIHHRPDGVLLFCAAGGSFVEKSLMALLARLLGATSFLFPREGSLIDDVNRSKFIKFVVRALLKGTNVFLSQGPTWSRFAIDAIGFNKKYVYTIPNWTAKDRHLKIGSKRNYIVSSDRPNIIFIGWLEEFKGVQELMQATLRLVNDGHKFHLTLAGGGGAEAVVKDYVVNNKLQDVVSFAGWVGTDDLDHLLTTNNIFVLPSWSEGLPNSMIEAMASGLAVVVTNVGMIPDYVCDNQHALLVTPKDVQSIYTALSAMILDINMRNRLARNGYHMALSQFSVDRSLTKLGDVIENNI